MSMALLDVCYHYNLIYKGKSLPKMCLIMIYTNYTYKNPSINLRKLFFEFRP